MNLIIKNLDLLELELKKLQLWDLQTPTQGMLASKEPFSVDVLSPSQWLQWIFIPKMKKLIETQMDIPKPFSIAPYFEEAFKDEADKNTLIDLIKHIDSIINGK